MARRLKVEGTNDFLIAAVVLAALGLWCVKDGWFPSKSVLAKHPREIVVSAGIPSVVLDVQVAPGAEVTAKTVVARVRSAQARPIATNSASDEVELRSDKSGVVTKVLAGKEDVVTAVQPIVMVEPEDHFYAFNKSFAILTLIGAIVCGFIHLTVR